MARGGAIHPRRLKDGATAFVVMYRASDGRQVKRTIRRTRREAKARLTGELAARAAASAVRGDDARAT